MRPPPLSPGDRVRVVAPSSPFDRALALRGIGFLAQRYRVEFDWACFERRGFLAGSDARRLTELDAALTDPGLRAIVAARGGYGLTRIAHLANWGAFVRHPKWIVGFSDITALHVEAASLNVASLHADHACGLGRGDAHARQAWIAALENAEPVEFAGLERWVAGDARGVTFGGNLTLLSTCAAAGRLRPPANAIWVLEDVTEAAYRIDRSLSALIARGAFDSAAAVVLGDFTDCPAGAHGVPVQEVLRERLSALGLPVAAGLPVGHDRINRPLPLGVPGALRGDALTVG